jgi:NAD-specific glutamate dehydrogenase
MIKPRRPDAAGVRAGPQGASVARPDAGPMPAVRDSFGLQELHRRVDALDARIPGALSSSSLCDRAGTFWWTASAGSLRNLELTRGWDEIVAHYRRGWRSWDAFPGLLDPAQAAAPGPLPSGCGRAVYRRKLAARLAQLPRTGACRGRAADRRPDQKDDRRGGRAFFGVARSFGFGRIDAMIGGSRRATITRGWRCRKRATAWRRRSATWPAACSPQMAGRRT